jgi:hypothetical protein
MLEVDTPVGVARDLSSALLQWHQLYSPSLWLPTPSDVKCILDIVRHMYNMMTIIESHYNSNDDINGISTFNQDRLWLRQQILFQKASLVINFVVAILLTGSLGHCLHFISFLSFIRARVPCHGIHLLSSNV